MVEHGIVMNLLIILALAMSLTACNPVDQKIQNPNDVKSYSDGSDHSSQNYRFASHAVDRAMESLHLLKVVMNSDYALKNGVVIVKSGNQSEISYGKENDSMKRKIIQTNSDRHESQMSLFFEGDIDLSKPLQALEIHNKDQSNIDEIFYVEKNKNNNKNDVIIKNINRVIKIQKLAEENKYLVEENTIDEVNIFRSGQIISMMSLNMVIEWDGKGESLSKPVKIVKLDLSSNRYGQKALAIFKSESTLEALLAENCPSVSGELTLTDAKTKQILKMSISDSTVTHSPEQKPMTAVSCGIRPVVDLRKLSSFH